MTRVAFVTGFTGQDGTFLTRLLLDKGYKVVGLVRRISTEPPRRIRGRFDFRDELANGQLVLEEGDLLSISSLIRIIGTHRPDEIYNLAAQSHVGLSFLQPEFTMATILEGTVNLIHALESFSPGPEYKFGIPVKGGYNWRMYQASTSEMFGDRPAGEPMDESSEFSPNSPYAIAKAAAHYYCAMKRKSGRFISCGILFNHESEIRGGDFVTQKIAKGVVNWLATGEPIALGNLNAIRDWGYAGDYVKAMHLMLQQNQPDDYVVATGEAHTVREFVMAAFGAAGIELTSHGDGLEERMTAIRGSRGGTAVVVDSKYYRPADVGFLNGNAAKIRALGWLPEVRFEDLVAKMVEAAKNGSH